ncbi:PREDICTED: early light-induced protein, chloroplastic-like [Ipomoea nil]|uniref:early light-induced protein, chloroplastic-like n=1 Tax=Ipomoea nil TaxID=35883 RepID=UPI000901814E|nr:PREDICTED: early light-induced protein, chloroplastic-like [Ipomoea nil]
MASTVVMQSILGSPVTSFKNRNGVSQFVPSSYLPRLQRNPSFLVRSMSEDDAGKEQPTTPVTESSTTAPKPTPPPSPAPKVAAKSSTNLWDVFSFSGPGPERINGRLAMIGFAAAMGMELANGGDLFAQISNGGVTWFLGSTALLTLASVIPLFQGVTAESKSKGLMTADAEIWNGRFAMLGLVALAFTEYVQNGPLLHV